jgi:hypothetical protein
VDLNNAGPVSTAQRFFDTAWPRDRPGKSAFLKGFAQQLRSGQLWCRYRLGVLLGADAIFR